MGNDKNVLQPEDLPFRFIEVPSGSAPPPPSPPSTRKSHTLNKRHAPPPPQRLQGYDASPTLLPPPVPPKRFDEPLPAKTQHQPIPPKRFDEPIIHPPRRSDLPQPTFHNNCYEQISTNRIVYRPRKIRKPKLACCVIS